MLKGKIIISYNDNTGIVEFYPEDFFHEEQLNYQKFVDINSAIIFYLNKKFYFQSFLDKKKKIQNYLQKETVKISNKLNRLKSEIEKGSKEEEFSHIANLLLINRNKLKSGMDAIELENIYNPGNLIEVKLDAKLSPQNNIDLYFEKSRNEKVRMSKSKLLFSNLEKTFSHLQMLKRKIDLMEKIEELKSIMKELKMKDEEIKKNKDVTSSKFKKYIIEGKYYLFVGKDSMNNDVLTTKFAKQNDYWFHARSVPGSHVVLRVDNTKEGVPKNILKKAAAIAAFHSKAKTAGIVPVSYTLKKYVIKKKNMEPGKVALLKEDVLLVKPEVPAGCEFIPNDEI
jgi:predicted ribosome quality control (RQC) complex YloA/Tae2 family protein